MLGRISKRIKTHLSNKCIFLCYHRVGNDVSDKWGNSVSPKNFKAQMEVVKKYLNPISMDTLFDTNGNISLNKKKSVAITFDDGYEINTKYAYEILEDLEIPAIFYTNTYHIGKEENFWWDIFQRIFYLNKLNSHSITIKADDISFELPFHNSESKENSLFILHRMLKTLVPDIRSKILDNLISETNLKLDLNEEYKPISESGIKKISDNDLFLIGGHSHSHCSLGLINTSLAKSEININKKILEEIIGKKIFYFSYPFGGKNDYNQKIIDIIKKCGFVNSVTTSRSLCYQKNERYEIPRFSMKNFQGDIFKSKMKNYFSNNF